MKPTGNGIRRWMYGDKLKNFLRQENIAILGELLQQSVGSVETTQRNAWEEQIRILKSLTILDEEVARDSGIYFELTVPRLGRRADVVLIVSHVMFILEFKAGESNFSRSSLDQVWDYALDLKYFHQSSHEICIIPILISTEGTEQIIEITNTAHKDRLVRPISASPTQLVNVINQGLAHFVSLPIDIEAWEKGRYMPTPTIVEAARALYAGHAVENISRSDAGARNLTVTANAIDEIID